MRGKTNEGEEKASGEMSWETSAGNADAVPERLWYSCECLRVKTFEPARPSILYNLVYTLNDHWRFREPALAAFFQLFFPYQKFSLCAAGRDRFAKCWPKITTPDCSSFLRPHLPSIASLHPSQFVQLDLYKVNPPQHPR